MALLVCVTSTNREEWGPTRPDSLSKGLCPSSIYRPGSPSPAAGTLFRRQIST